MTSQNNSMTLIMLKGMGFPMVNIRRAMLRLQGVSHHHIAKQLEVSRQNVGHHVNGLRSGQRIQQAIADTLEVSVDDLFPEIPNHDQG